MPIALSKIKTTKKNHKSSFCIEQDEMEEAQLSFECTIDSIRVKKYINFITI